MKKIKSFAMVMGAALLLSGCNETVAEAISKEDTNKKENTTTQSTEVETANKVNNGDISIGIGGDLVLDSWEGRVDEHFSTEIINLLNNVDISCVNNEFVFTDKEEAIEDKTFVYKSDSVWVQMMEDLGIDSVSLANNHSCEYKEAGLIDTMKTLEDKKIKFFGAGKNKKEAKEPVIFSVKGKKIAFIGASMAEKNIMTPEATEDKAGILSCYESDGFVQTVAEIADKSDYVVAYVHWGKEFESEVTKEQRKLAYELVDAGADVIVGAHSHCYQGVEYYNGTPIMYGLGNLWTSDKVEDSLIAVLYLGVENNGISKVSVVPLECGNGKTSYPEEEKRTEVFKDLRKIAKNAVIDKNGGIFPEE